ncbi:sensor histidine kinase [Cohnella pontilimi]|uniref:histidine kinase n=1 Tax=Cohnella pontilimi TaxID=2564100 RepID=A0A4U0F4W2_9BACL|nr:sensor histidine kinase [Cohnella pontilimi]TJY39621.1 sensor histidine kinase [Cohnella pontilimi]
MRQSEIPAEFWSICHKSIILLYVVVSSSFSSASASHWDIVFVLLYLSVNLCIYIVKRVRLKPLFMLVSVLMVSAFAYRLDPLFLLLLPAGMYELASAFIPKNQSAILLFLLMAPLAFLPSDFMLLYGLVALLGFVFGEMQGTYSARIEAYRKDLETMRGRVDQLAKSLNENTEYIRQSEYTFKLEERNRLSQEIHDKIGHSMTGALIQMEASKRLLASDAAKSAELLQNAIHISKDGIESIRQVLKNMKPPTEQLGINRLKLLIDEFSAKHPVSTVLTHEGNVDLITPIHWKVILENTKEALTNILKYSDATAVSVSIQVLGTLIKAEVSDNGKGTPKLIKGLGIIGMEERAAGVNGKVIVDGSRGFSVTTLLPYGQP